MEFPIFSGSEDPLIWIYRCEKFFLRQCIAALDRMGLAALHMLDEAQLWDHQVEREHPGIGWEEFTKQCTIQFGPSTHTNPLSDLILLEQSGNVAEYLNIFQKKLACPSHVVQVDHSRIK
ncbi:uncharacterized protein [Aristolochia californica]|uniref:uncharacterized protein n=1 Tax=Aristolochia californica TaxID=171875 RepID=UPI0035D59CE5